VERLYLHIILWQHTFSHRLLILASLGFHLRNDLLSYAFIYFIDTISFHLLPKNIAITVDLSDGVHLFINSLYWSVLISSFSSVATSLPLHWVLGSSFVVLIFCDFDGVLDMMILLFRIASTNFKLSLDHLFFEVLFNFEVSTFIWVNIRFNSSLNVTIILRGKCSNWRRLWRNFL